MKNKDLKGNMGAMKRGKNDSLWLTNRGTRDMLNAVNKLIVKFIQTLLGMIKRDVKTQFDTQIDSCVSNFGIFFK
jgi:hypothetical protein